MWARNLTLEERQRIAYARGYTELADLLDQMIETDNRAAALQAQILELEARIAELEGELAETEQAVVKKALESAAEIRALMATGLSGAVGV